MTGLEPATTWSQIKHATTCTTSRKSRGWDSNPRYRAYEARLVPSPVYPAVAKAGFEPALQSVWRTAGTISSPLCDRHKKAALEFIPLRLGNQIISIQLVDYLLPLHPTSKSRIIHRHKMTLKFRHTLSVCSAMSHIHFHHHCYVSHKYLPFCTKKHLSASFPFAF